MDSGATTTVPTVVKAGYWLCGSRYFIRSEEDHIPFELFTHLYAAFAEVNPISGMVTVPEQCSDQFRDFKQTVRARSSTVKTLLSIGGEGSHISSVVEDEQRRNRFIWSSIDLARSFHFDGLDLCWLYPSPADNADSLDSLLKDWRAAVDDEASRTIKPTLLLTAAVYHHPVIPRSGTLSFRYTDISKYLDWINVLAMDFYTPSNSNEETGPVHGWRTGPREPNRCGSHGIGNWSAIIADQTQKLVLSLPFYGYKWTLDNPNTNGFFAPAHPATNKNPISYRNIPLNEPNDTTYYLASYSALQNERSWFGYDSASDISGKVKEAIGNSNLRGYLAWHVGADDEDWTLSGAASKAADAIRR